MHSSIDDEGETLPLSAAAGASNPAPIAAGPGPMPLSELLTTGFTEAHRKEYLLSWANQIKNYVDGNLVKFLAARSSKVSFPVASQVLLFSALEIKTAASGAQLTSFREVMHHENLIHAVVDAAAASPMDQGAADLSHIGGAAPGSPSGPRRSRCSQPRRCH